VKCRMCESGLECTATKRWRIRRGVGGLAVQNQVQSDSDQTKPGLPSIAPTTISTCQEAATPARRRSYSGYADFSVPILVFMNV
jgi:hypothetical protein